MKHMSKLFWTVGCSRRKPFQLLVAICLIFIIALILYLIGRSEETDFYEEHNLHYVDFAHQEDRNKIITVTGRSYEAKLGRIKVYLCKSSLVNRPDQISISWNNRLWQQVGDPSQSNGRSTPVNDLFLYSAYFDNRLRRTYNSVKHIFIRILAMMDGEIAHTNYYCQIWLGLNASRPIVVDAEFLEIWSRDWVDSTASNSSKMYKPYLLSCILPKKYSANHISPIFVSISVRPCANATTVYKIPIQSDRGNSSDSPKFAICVKPLDFDKDMSSELIQWIELNSILGAARVDIYTFRVHPNVVKVLDYYRRIKSEKVRVFPMTLPGHQPNFPVERSNFLRRNTWQKRRNELIPYNDCLYRNMYEYDYIIPLDIDEILVPKLHNSWHDLFQHLGKTEPEMMNVYASYSVRNAYFFETFSASVSDNTNNTLYFLRHLHRSANFSEANKAVKSFVRTDKTLTVFNHYALDAVVPGVATNTNFPPELIQMNHYRKTCPKTIFYDCKHNFLKYTMLDDILMKFKDELEKATNEILLQLNFQEK